MPFYVQLQYTTRASQWPIGVSSLTVSDCRLAKPVTPVGNGSIGAMLASLAVLLALLDKLHASMTPLIGCQRQGKFSFEFFSPEYAQAAHMPSSHIPEKRKAGQRHELPESQLSIDHRRLPGLQGQSVISEHLHPNLSLGVPPVLPASLERIPATSVSQSSSPVSQRPQQAFLASTESTDVLPGGDDIHEPDNFYGESSSYDFVRRFRHGSGLVAQEEGRNGFECRAISSSTPAYASVVPQRSPASPKVSLYDLPPRALADRLVDTYFSRWHRMYPFIHEGTFRSEYEQMWERHPALGIPQAWLALLNMIFCYAWEYCNAFDDNYASSAYTFFNRAMALLNRDMLVESTLQMVQALLFVCHYLLGSLEVHKCWNVMGLMSHSAISAGLHLSPTKMNVNSVEKEVRKRVWLGGIMMDRTLGMKYGRPPIVRIPSSSAPEQPAEVDDQYISPAIITPRQPIDHPSLISFYIHNCKIAPILERILGDLYHNGSSRYFGKDVEHTSGPGERLAQMLGTTTAIDGQLTQWYRSAPPHLRDHEKGHNENIIFQRQWLTLSVM